MVVISRVDLQQQIIDNLQITDQRGYTDLMECSKDINIIIEKNKKEFEEGERMEHREWWKRKG